MYSATTHSVTVSVVPEYMPKESSPADNVYVWSYKVRIENNGGETLQLKSRTWRITDAYGRMQELHGAGVVGEEPVIGHGASYEYTSGTPLPTPSGIMTGSYTMQREGGGTVDVTIPAFSLHTPGMAQRPN